MGNVVAETCTWCGVEIEQGDGFRLSEAAGERRAAFCRLEHVVPWGHTGAHWEPGEITEPANLADSIDVCAECGGPLPDTRLLLVRHRGDHRIPDCFCSVDHLTAWAKKGGRWQ